MGSGEKQSGAETYISPRLDYIGSLDELTQGSEGSGTDSFGGASAS